MCIHWGKIGREEKEKKEKEIIYIPISLVNARGAHFTELFVCLFVCMGVIIKHPNDDESIKIETLLCKCLLFCQGLTKEKENKVTKGL